jgi:hypothetical protein
MIVLRFNRQGEDIIEHSDGLQVSCIYIFVYKGEDIIEHTNGRCHVFTF